MSRQCVSEILRLSRGGLQALLEGLLEDEVTAHGGAVQYARTRGLNATWKDHPLRQIEPTNRDSESSLRVKPFGPAQGRLRNLAILGLIRSLCSLTMTLHLLRLL